ncbi:Phosphoribosylformylglycinamidine synthase, partial [Phytophthora megakarya]
MASSPEKKQKTTSISSTSSLLRFYRTPAFTAHANRTLLAHLRAHVADGLQVDELVTEYCFYVETKADAETLSAADQETLHWLLSETFEPQQTRPAEPFLATSSSNEWLVEVGPRMNFSTAWSSNAVAICQACGISSIKRIERATRYLV